MINGSSIGTLKTKHGLQNQAHTNYTLDTQVTMSLTLEILPLAPFKNKLHSRKKSNNLSYNLFEIKVKIKSII